MTDHMQKYRTPVRYLNPSFKTPNLDFVLEKYTKEEIEIGFTKIAKLYLFKLESQSPSLHDQTVTPHYAINKFVNGNGKVGKINYLFPNFVKKRGSDIHPNAYTLIIAEPSIKLLEEVAKRVLEFYKLEK